MVAVTSELCYCGGLVEDHFVCKDYGIQTFISLRRIDKIFIRNITRFRRIDLIYLYLK